MSVMLSIGRVKVRWASRIVKVGRQSRIRRTGGLSGCNVDCRRARVDGIGERSLRSLLYCVDQPIPMRQNTTSAFPARNDRTTERPNDRTTERPNDRTTDGIADGITYQSKPSSRPSPLIAQLPLTLHSLPFSWPANPSLSDISPGDSAPSTSCLLANTRTGTDLSSSSESMVRSSEREVARRGCRTSR
jgi:hypothetical protein